MEIQMRSDGNSKGNKNSLGIGKNSNSRKISKTNTKKSCVKGTPGSKSHLPRSKIPQLQNVSSVKDAQNGKFGAPKPLVKLPCSTNKIPKGLERHIMKPLNVIRPKSTTKSNVNLLKSTTKSVNVYRNDNSSPSFELKGDLKKNETIAATKLNNKISVETKIIGHAAREVITATKELAMVTEVDQKTSHENEALFHTKSNEIGYIPSSNPIQGNIPSYMTGAIPKTTQQDMKSNNDSSMRAKSNIKNKNRGKSNEDEEKFEELKLSAATTFHPDGIAETLKELDQQMESENSMSKPSKHKIKEDKTTMKKKHPKSKKTSRTNHEEGKEDKLNDFENSSDTMYGLKKIDKYLCSLSGGEAQKLQHKNDASNLDAIDVTEKIHTPNINLETQSFPLSSNCPAHTDVSFLLGNSAASKISSSQKSIAEKWKQKPVSPIDSQSTTSKKPQCNQMEKDNILPDASEKNVTDIDKYKLIWQDDTVNPNTVQKEEVSLEETDIIEEFSCPICYEVLLAPQQLDPCKHIFCDPCLRRMADAPRSEAAGCPMCRAEIKSCTTNEGEFNNEQNFLGWIILC
jgi:hypothetical protein